MAHESARFAADPTAFVARSMSTQMRSPLARARLRRTYAALAGVLWLLGIEVLPNLHLALHERPHTHAPDGTVVIVTFDRDAEPHRHADGTMHSHDTAGIERSARAAHSSPRHRARSGTLAIEQAPDTHVAAGLAHHATALHAAPPPVIDAIAIDRIAIEARFGETGRAIVAVVTTRDARGPPLARAITFA